MYLRKTNTITNIDLPFLSVTVPLWMSFWCFFMLDLLAENPHSSTLQISFFFFFVNVVGQVPF